MRPILGTRPGRPASWLATVFSAAALLFSLPHGISAQAGPDKALQNQVTVTLKLVQVYVTGKGKQPVTEQMVYAVLFNFLNALAKTGVGVCGGPVVHPLAGRTEDAGSRN
jgi:hypothetical protein